MDNSARAEANGGVDGATSSSKPDTNEDPFAPLTNRSGTEPPRFDDELWEPQYPAPELLPAPGQIRCSGWSAATQVWVYRGVDGLPLHMVARFERETAEGRIEKQTLPYSFGRRVWTTKAGNRLDQTGWHFKAPLPPRPLYGLDRLAVRPGAPVMLLEGEKAADAAALLFPDYVAVCSQGGSNAGAKADWAPLSGRAVTIWPDRDAPGLTYAASARTCLRQVGAGPVAVVDVPVDWPEGWDLADPPPDGIISEDLAELLADAERAAADPAAAAAEFRAAEIERLSKLSLAEYQAARKDAAARLGLGVVTLDKLVQAARAKRAADAAAKARNRPPPAPGETRWPPGFFMRPEGLYADCANDEPPKWICPEFEVLGQGRDSNGEGWGLWLQWRDDDGRPHQWAMPARLLMVGPGELEAELVNRGLQVSADPGSRTLLRRALSEVKSGSRVTTVDRPGWHFPTSGRASYVMLDGTVIADATERVVLRSVAEGAAAMIASAGSLAGWQQDVAAKAEGNDVAAFCLCLGFVGPMMDVAGEASGGFHIFGRSKVGKTLVAGMAVSIWGPPRKGLIMRDWRSTANGLELAAADSNDGLLVLDEIHQVEPRELIAAVYMLANEGGKSRARRDVSSARKKTWRLPILSTGEVDVASMAAKAGQTLTAGAQVRMPSLPVDATTMWPKLHGHADARALMADLHAAMRAHHGTAGRAFVQCLTETRNTEPDELADLAAAMRDRFAAMLGQGVDAQVHDVARRCALVAFAGEMAIAWGILPWHPNDAVRAAKAMLTLWLQRRGGKGSTEDSHHVRTIRLFLVEHGAARFVRLQRSLQTNNQWQVLDPERPVINRAGWVYAGEDGRDVYVIDPDVWRNICTAAGADPTETARTLRAAGLLAPADGTNLARYVTIPNAGRIRAYVILPDIVGGASDNAANADL